MQKLVKHDPEFKTLEEPLKNLFLLVLLRSGLSALLVVLPRVPLVPQELWIHLLTNEHKTTNQSYFIEIKEKKTLYFR